MKTAIFFMFLLAAIPAWSFEDRLLELVGLRASSSVGPNCWNLALYSTGLVSSLRNVDESEFKSLLESPLCRKLAAREPVRRGDIGAIRENDPKGDIEVHGFAYINEDQVFTKNGDDSRSAVEVMRFADLMRVSLYDVESECRFGKLESCVRFIDRYRCQSLNHFIQSGNVSSKPLLQLYSALVDFESSYQKNVLFGSKLDPVKTKSEIDRISNSIQNFEQNRQASPTAVDELLRKILEIHLTGVSGQIYYTHAGKLMAIFEQFASRLGKADARFADKPFIRHASLTLDHELNAAVGLSTLIVPVVGDRSARSKTERLDF